MNRSAPPLDLAGRSPWDDPAVVERGLTIRRIEETFLTLFAAGKLNGTVHTSIGQEYSALAFAGGVLDGDWVVSNHRCHGHFLASPYGDPKALVAELLGKRSGVCCGIGSSQHLYRGRFLSNGVQGGILPIAAGLAYAERDRSEAIALAFIGDGTLGEGVVYEVMNAASLWNLPLLIVCEDNGIAQTTPRDHAVAGEILARARAFGIQSWEATTDDPEAIFKVADEAIARTRTVRAPGFVHVRTHRLGPHSKGDDTRDAAAIVMERARDPLDRLLADESFVRLDEAVRARIERIVIEASDDEELAAEHYLRYEPPPRYPVWSDVQSTAYSGRTVERINAFFHEFLAADSRARFVGEDVLSPYGGAFKVAKELSARFPQQVLSTPISEAAIVGLSAGAALGGLHPFVEIMFGDFATLAFDQIVNHAAKFRDMYAGAVRCPVVIRLPMGGRRGYGPTHSQTLEKVLAGIDGVRVVAVSRAVDPSTTLTDIAAADEPVLVVENKVDYGKPALAIPRGFRLQQSAGPLPAARIRGERDASLTLVTYGAAAEIGAQALESLFTEYELDAELIILTSLRPLDIGPVLDSVAQTHALITIEEASVPFGIGAEIIARTCEALAGVRVARVGSAPVAVPSPRSLEAAVLPDSHDIVQAAGALLGF